MLYFDLMLRVAWTSCSRKSANSIL